MATVVKNIVLSFVNIFSVMLFGYVINGTCRSQVSFAVKCLVILGCCIVSVLGSLFVDSLKGDRQQIQSAIGGTADPARKEN
ncbi:unnamed protein product [Linum trigynum]|uniref:Uncharacterized protein n=1 Tax=Linum trigynum TaxID=586398 RepID=A0AAV2D6S6_9ROSI